MSQQHLKSADVPVALSPELLALAKTTVTTAIGTTFVTDTLLGPGLPHAISAISSTVKRHGSLIERGIVEALERSNRYIVLRNIAMPITTAAERLVAGNPPADLARLSVSCYGEHRQIAFLDLIAIDIESDHAIIVEIKRGSGVTEVKKRRQTERTLRAARLQARSFLQSLDYQVESAEVRVIDYYGRSGFPADLTVTRHELDAAFKVPVAGTVEAMTSILQRSLHREVPQLLQLALNAVEDGALPIAEFANPVTARRGRRAPVASGATAQTVQ